MASGAQSKGNGLQLDSMSTGEISLLVCQALLSKAASLARKGEYVAAAGVLRAFTDKENPHPRALDLLARIHAQQGRFSEAEACWQRALQIEPNHDSYLAGLKRIARMRSRTRLAGLLLSLGSALAAILLVLFVANALRMQIAELRGAFLHDIAQLNASPRQQVQTEEKAPAPPQMAIQLNGAVVRTEPDVIVVLFDEGLFLSRDELKPEAKTLLSELGRQLRPYASNVSIRVVGYTDDVPIPEGLKYKNNTALGVARAVAVVNYLRNNAGLPAGLFHLQLAEEFITPYPNDTPANRLRNRTAVIRIYPSQGYERRGS